MSPLLFIPAPEHCMSGFFEPNLLSSEEHTIGFGATKGLGGGLGSLIPNFVLRRLRISTDLSGSSKVALEERFFGRVGEKWWREDDLRGIRGGGGHPMSKMSEEEEFFLFKNISLVGPWDGPQYHLTLVWAFHLQAAFTGFVFFVGMPLNATVLVATLRYRKLRQPLNYILVNVSLGGFIYSIFSLSSSSPAVMNTLSSAAMFVLWRPSWEIGRAHV